MAPPFNSERTPASCAGFLPWRASFWRKSRPWMTPGSVVVTVTCSSSTPPSSCPTSRTWMCRTDDSIWRPSPCRRSSTCIIITSRTTTGSWKETTTPTSSWRTWDCWWASTTLPSPCTWGTCISPTWRLAICLVGRHMRWAGKPCDCCTMKE